MIRVLVLAAMVIPGLVCADTTYVSPSGSNSHPGTEAKPFRTLAKGVRGLAPGDTLLVRAGVYAESLYATIPSGTSWDRPVTMKAYPGEEVILKPDSGIRVLHFQSNQQYIVVDGLILDASGVTYDALKIGFNWTSPSAHHIRVMNCEIKNAPEQGILIVGTGADDNEFINLDVHDNGTTEFDHGIYVCTDRNLISGCSFYRNAGWGIHIYSEDEGYEPDENVVRNCRAYDNGQAGDRSVGIGIYTGHDNVVHNSQAWGNKVGVAIRCDALRTKFFNNVVYNNTYYGVHVDEDSRDTVIRNNIVYGGGVAFLEWGQGTVFDHNLWIEDPQFSDAANGDFSLQPGSPAIDAGAAIPEVTVDCVGTPRPQGLTYDIGAYETVAEEPAARPKAAANLRVINTH